MQLVIAEKPSVARDLARALGMRASGQNAIVGPDRVITWCIGHLVELEEPAAYDARWKSWRMDTLPMLPDTFKLRAVAGTSDQLRVVREHLRDRRFEEVVNACDAGREGELIFRYVYDLAGSRLRVRRLWISSLTEEAIRQGFAGLRPGRDYDALGDAARCRSEADWLVGMNATRAVTLRFRAGEAPRREGDKPPVYSIGRVQTPTLAILVRREQAIRAFKPEDYWEVKGAFRAADEASSFAASWFVKRPGEKTALTRFPVRQMADDVVARDALHGDASLPTGPVIESLSQRQTREPPPALFDLTSLQRTANRRWGISASATLDAAQALYERHKVLTYPRTDSRHLPRDQANELPRVFGGLHAHADYAAFVAPLLARLAGPGGVPAFAGLKRIFDDTKVHDHHAIIPTGKLSPPGALGRDEQRIYDLVVRRFLGAFHPDAEFALTEAIVRVGSAEPLAARAATPARLPASPARVAPGSEASEAEPEARLKELPPLPDRFVARGRVRLVAGWQTVAGLDERRPPARGERAEGESASAEATLPVLALGQRLHGSFEAQARQTRPPPRHTEATLLGAMESAGKEMEDEELRAAMKDTGLGTPATRASTIETLIKRGFIAREGKAVIATPTGIELIERLPVVTLASPELTGAWEARLTRIARGQDNRAAFMTDIARYVADMTSTLREMGTPGPRSSGGAPSPSRASLGRQERESVAPPERARSMPQDREGAVRTRAPSQPPSKAPNRPANKAPNRPTNKAPSKPASKASKTRRPAPSSAPGEPPVPAAALTLPCPRCRQGTLLAGHRGWGCSRWREGCGFVIWFELDGRRLTDTQLRDLIEKGKTRKSKWSAPGAEPRSGRLVLDVNGPRERGGARFQAEVESSV